MISNIVNFNSLRTFKELEAVNAIFSQRKYKTDGFIGKFK
jgi:hypothetical protein